MRKVMTETELKMDVLNNATMNRTYSDQSTPKIMDMADRPHRATLKKKLH
jgi:hypothetical protein